MIVDHVRGVKRQTAGLKTLELHLLHKESYTSIMGEGGGIEEKGNSMWEKNRGERADRISEDRKVGGECVEKEACNIHFTQVTVRP